MEDSNTEWAKISAAVILPNIIGFISGQITSNELKTWYVTVRKPWFTPPNWLFAPVWATFFTCIGYSSYIILRDGAKLENGAQNCALGLYVAQFALNVAWSPIFFNFHSFKWGLIDIAVATATAACAGAAFYQINRSAGLIFIPYVAWLCFSTVLNYEMWKLNKKPIAADKQN